jgi:tetratricopeptide (TPR) repeat protein
MQRRHIPTAKERADWVDLAPFYQQKIANGTMTGSDWFAKAICELFIAQDDEAAVISCDRALAYQPDDGMIWDLKGCALGVQGHLAEALTAFERALASDSAPPLAEQHEALCVELLALDGDSPRIH